jgi:hypothetical protein
MLEIKCAIVGQSNALFGHGFAASLAERSGIVATRYGAGLSSALLGPFFVQPGFCAGLDFCIVDLAMVEPPRQGGADADALRRYLRHVVHIARADGCCPILVAFAPAHVVADGRSLCLTEAVSDIVKVHRVVAARERCPIFDWASFVAAKRAEDPRLALEDFYEPPHDGPGEPGAASPRAIYQAEVAAYLHAYMEAHLKAERAPVGVSVDLALFTNTMLGETVSGAVEVRRSTDPMSRTFLRIADGEAIEVPANDVDRLAGYTVDPDGCVGRVRFSGDGVIVQDLQFPDGGEDGDLRHHIVPVIAPFRPLGGRLAIEVLGQDATETAHDPARADLVWPSASGAIEIEALIFEQPSGRRYYTTTHLVGKDEGDIVAVCRRDPRFQPPPVSVPVDGSRTTPTLSIVAHVGSRGDTEGADGTVQGDGDEQNIRGFSIEAPRLPPDQLRYRVRKSDGRWTAWAFAGEFVGSREEGQDLTGLSVRLDGAFAESHDLVVTGAFRGVADDVVVKSGAVCVPSTGAGSLWRVQLTLRRKADADLVPMALDRAMPDDPGVDVAPPLHDDMLIVIRTPAIDDHLRKYRLDLQKTTSHDVKILVHDETGDYANDRDLIAYSTEDINRLGVTTFDDGRWDTDMGDYLLYAVFDRFPQCQRLLMIDRHVKLNCDIDELVARGVNRFDFVALYAGFSDPAWYWHGPASLWFNDPRGSYCPIVAVSRELAKQGLKKRVWISNAWFESGAKPEDVSKHKLPWDAFLPSLCADFGFAMCDISSVVPRWNSSFFKGFGLFPWDLASLDDVAAVYPCLPNDAIPDYFEKAMESPYISQVTKDELSAEWEELKRQGVVQ